MTNGVMYDIYMYIHQKIFAFCSNNKESAQELGMLFICFLGIPKCPIFIEVFNFSSTYLLTLIFLLEILYFLHQGNVTTYSQEIHQD